MLAERSYKPNDGDILYHYCGPDAFAAICTGKNLRLTDLFSMNDFMELHWGYQIWEKAAGQMLSQVGRAFLDRIDEIIHYSGFNILLVGSCFSLDGDMLSQWRAYGSDGLGYAIGFESNMLLELPVRPLRVLYDEEKQLQEAIDFIRTVHLIEQKAVQKNGNDFFNACATFAADLSSFKNPCFAEEREVRAIHALNLERSGTAFKLSDEGGRAFGAVAKGEPIKFLMKDGIPVAFIEIDITNKGNYNPVREVVVGPKNNAILDGVGIFLETLDIRNVVVRKSKAPYR